MSAQRPAQARLGQFAGLPAGTGPIAGPHAQAQRLNALPGLALLHLRPGYFMEYHQHAAGAVVARELVDTHRCGVLHLQAPRHCSVAQAAGRATAAA